MRKRFGLILVALLIVPALLTACSSESSDAAEDYIEAVLKNDEGKALELACDSFEEQTRALMAYYASTYTNIHNIDLKYDMGKGNNQEEIIVTGSFAYGAEDDDKEFEITQKLNSLIILDMQEVDGDWCVTEDSVFEGTPLDTEMSEGEAAEDEAADDQAPGNEAADDQAATSEAEESSDGD
jgi:hypothetical protein